MRMLHKCRKILGAIYVRKVPTKFKGQCYPTATHSTIFYCSDVGPFKGTAREKCWNSINEKAKMDVWSYKKKQSTE